MLIVGCSASVPGTGCACSVNAPTNWVNMRIAPSSCTCGASVPVWTRSLAQLAALDPLAILNRGYAVLSDIETGKVVSSVHFRSSWPSASSAGRRWRIYGTNGGVMADGLNFEQALAELEDSRQAVAATGASP